MNAAAAFTIGTYVIGLGSVLWFLTHCGRHMFMEGFRVVEHSNPLRRYEQRYSSFPTIELTDEDLI